MLWTDKDNLALVKKFLPWFRKPYRELSSEIYRADAVRNAYMGVFGGVYADLDTECTRPYDTLFSTYNISTAPYLELNQTLSAPPSFPITSPDNDTDIDIANENSTSSTAHHTTPSPTPPPPQKRKAFLGRMGTDTDNIHSIPNAWMASTPGHPFWLLPLQHIAAKLSGNPNDSPEAITGPASLFETIGDYNDFFHNADFPTLDQHYAGSGWSALYPPPIPAEELVILPFWAIYPFSWQRDGDAYKAHCLVGQERFDAARCKEVIGVKAWGSWSVTYWSHSWNQNGQQEHMEELQDEGTIAQKQAEKEEKEEEDEKAREKQEEEEEREWEEEMGTYGDDPDDDDDDEHKHGDGDDGWKGEKDDDIEDETLLKQEMAQLLDEEDDDHDRTPALPLSDGNPNHSSSSSSSSSPPNQQQSPSNSSSTNLTSPTPPNFGTITESKSASAPQQDIPTNRVQQKAASAAAMAASAEQDQQRRLDKLRQQEDAEFQPAEAEEELEREEGFGLQQKDRGGMEELEEMEDPYLGGLLSRSVRRMMRRGLRRI